MEVDIFEHFFELVDRDTEALGGPELDEGNIVEEEVVINSWEENQFGRRQSLLEQPLLMALV